MGLTDNQQAIITFVSVFLLTLGTAGAVIPGFVPEDFKVPFAVIFWIFGIVGLSLMQALGITPAATQPPQTSPGKTQMFIRAWPSKFKFFWKA
jgi:hypothetical protein